MAKATRSHGMSRRSRGVTCTSSSQR